MVDASGKSFDPLYAFGHGLSYTTFEYSAVATDRQSYSRNDTIHLTFSVSNNGNLSGKEVIQIYVKDIKASITPPVKRLRAFDKVSLDAGKKKDLSYDIPIRDLAFVGQDNTWIVEPGSFEIMVGGYTMKIEVTE